MCGIVFALCTEPTSAAEPQKPGIVVYAEERSDWFEVSNDQFVIYSNQNEKLVRTTAEKLQRLCSALEILKLTQSETPSPSNRLTIYFVANDTQVKKIYGSNRAGWMQNLWSFYLPRAGDSFAIVPKNQVSAWGIELDNEPLFHEFFHHLMYRSKATIYPLWLTEGAAYFIDSVKFEKDGGVTIGAPKELFSLGLATGQLSVIPMAKLFDTQSLVGSQGRDFGDFSVTSWLLYHMLVYDSARSGQLAKFVEALAAGRPEIEAAQFAFGDLELLREELKKYAAQNRFTATKVAASQISKGDIEIRHLAKGDAAIMPSVVRSRRVFDLENEAPPELFPAKKRDNFELPDKIAEDARRLASVFPHNLMVLAELAQAEYDAGNDEAAIAAANLTLAQDATRIDTAIVKGYALERIALKTQYPSPEWAEMRRQFQAVNRLEPDNPIALLHYYLSFKLAGQQIDDNAIAGLERALQLAPFDEHLRLLLAEQYFADKRFQNVVTTLMPLVTSAHKSARTVTAAELLADARRRLAEAGQ